MAIPQSRSPILSIEKELVDKDLKRHESDDLKHTGFLGLIFLPDGTIMSELSYKEPTHPKLKGHELRNQNIPLLVPKNRKHLKDIVKGNHTKEIIDNAVDHALDRFNKGMSPFAEPEEIAYEGKRPIYIDEMGREKNVDIHGNKLPIDPKDLMQKPDKAAILNYGVAPNKTITT